MFIRNFLVALLLGAVGQQAHAVQKLIIPIKGLPSEFDPQKIQTIYEMVINLQTHRGLMRFAPNLAVAPDIAQSYEVFDEGKRVRFKLAPRKFADGTPVKAVHVVRTFHRLFTLGGGFAADLNYIEGSERILNTRSKTIEARGFGVTALDDSTVEFRLVKPVAMFLAHLATVDAAILPLGPDLKFNAERDGGAGPYLLTSHDRTRIVLTLSEAAHADHPQAPKVIELQPFETAEATLAAADGRIHGLDGYSVAQAELKKLLVSGWKESVSTITRQLYLVQNPTRVPKYVRDAVFDAIVSQPEPLLPRPFSKSFGLIPDSLQGSLSAKDVQVGGCRVSSKAVHTVKLSIVGSEPTFVAIANRLTDLLRPCRIKLIKHTIALKEYMPAVTGGDYDIIIQSKFLDYPDGLSVLTYFRSNYSANTFFINDRAVDSLLDKAIAELDLAKRVSLYRDVQKKILNHKIVVPLLFGSDNRGLWHPSVHAVPAHPLGIQGLPFESIMVSGNE